MKMQTLFLAFLFACFGMVNAQGKYSTKTGEIRFEASVPLFEEVKAKNTNVSAILNCDTGDFAALALVKGFRFKVALMEEHFNENYIESSTYPKAIVKGKIKDFNFSELGPSEKQFMLTGTIMLHGQEQPIAVPLRMQIAAGNIIAIKADFSLKPETFNIKVPKIVSNKIDETIAVSTILLLSN